MVSVALRSLWVVIDEFEDVMARVMSDEISASLSKEYTKINFGENPYREPSIKYNLFEQIRKSSTVMEARANGASLWDLKE